MPISPQNPIREIPDSHGCPGFRNNANTRWVYVIPAEPLTPQNCADGSLLCRCHYTDEVFRADAGIVLGPVLPQAPYSYLCHKDAAPARNRSVKLFNEVEQNCNTCRKLQRLPFNRMQYGVGSGLMPGRCESIPDTHHYHRGDHFMFPPEDWMGMECHEPR